MVISCYYILWQRPKKVLGWWKCIERAWGMDILWGGLSWRSLYLYLWSFFSELVWTTWGHIPLLCFHNDLTFEILANDLRLSSTRSQGTIFLSFSCSVILRTLRSLLAEWAEVLWISRSVSRNITAAWLLRNYGFMSEKCLGLTNLTCLSEAVGGLQGLSRGCYGTVTLPSFLGRPPRVDEGLCPVLTTLTPVAKVSFTVVLIC